MANYPEWVLKHKKKGTYINKVGDKYYLYAAHSERIKGTNKVRRVSDGYLGRITEQDGLIPPKDKLSSAPLSFELGLSFPILFVTTDIFSGFQKSFRKNGPLIYVCSILFYIYGFYSNELFHQSYLHVLFRDLSIPSSFLEYQTIAIARGFRMISTTMEQHFDRDLPLLRASFSNVHLVEVNSKYYCCGISDTVASLSKKYNISWRNSLWQK